MNKMMQRDFKGTPLVTESLKLLRVHHGAEFLLGKPIKVLFYIYLPCDLDKFFSRIPDLNLFLRA
jgi:hypothetical protein